MRKLALAAMSILLLLAVATPVCLAAENSASNQQHASQYSKLPPLQLSGSPLAQKEYLQAFLWIAQNSRQSSTSTNEDEWLGISTTKATVLSSIAALIAAIMAPVISIFVARKTMTQTRQSLADDFTQRRLEQKDNFKFQLYQLALEEKKKAMLKFFESTSIPELDQKHFNMDAIRTQMTMLEMLMDKKFYETSHVIFTYLHKNLYNFRWVSHDAYIRQQFVDEYKLLHLDLANEIRRVLRGEDFDPTLTASNSSPNLSPGA
ncbi:hypothetical protein SDC9_14442 [bioreactor metagenome]|uniref:DUF4760 domain-containing protein n=1 Tax=bioreactor metagenome TaxID=1076179 RepID=A0A644TP83_9ZZZZ|nr:hypothetical protein [Desulfovibrio desulfuricans]MEA4990698.1 hypothetical protein [Desulfovibrio desulfuricans]